MKWGGGGREKEEAERRLWREGGREGSGEGGDRVEDTIFSFDEYP